MKFNMFLLMIFFSTSVFAKNEITWLGQSALWIKTSEGKQIIIDPFIMNNPKTPKKFKDKNLYKNIDLVLITHGHGDHLGDYSEILSNSKNAKISMNADMGNVMIGRKMIDQKKYFPLNKSGELNPFGDKLKVIMVRAEHSSSISHNNEVVYGGEPVGYIIEFSNGKKIYHAGDTGVFGDMKMIGSYYKPDIAFVPIGGNYTMGPKEAAYAIDELIKPKQVIPFHYGTFPIINKTPAEFKSFLKNKKRIKVIKPGDTIKI